MTDLRFTHDPQLRSFASDNCAGAHPEVLAAVVAANEGHLPSYGHDGYTAAFEDLVRDLFGPAATAYPVFTGTGANVVALAMMTDRWDAVICTETAHVNVDECGAPEKLAGVKLLAIPTSDGKLTPSLVESKEWLLGFEHHAQPRVVTLTQATELGTVYSVDELAALCDAAHRIGLSVHLDGARLANAAAGLGVSLGELTTAVGVDVVSLGGTKNGLLGAEAVVVLNPEAVRAPRYIRKLTTQLPSKTRFISAQLLALYGTDLWLRSAAHANAMATRLAAAVGEIPGVQVTRPVQANAVFAILDPAAAEQVRRSYPFYTWDEARGEVRWMCSFDTREQDVDAFVACVAEAANTALPLTTDGPAH
ncbi:MAG: low specificity L-threonine aldolase [Austwickia sp.]|nr:low specificity L-threonine aldolase [Austwickia sp.]